MNNIISNWNIVHQTGSLIIYSTPVTINNINYISNVLTINLDVSQNILTNLLTTDISGTVYHNGSSNIYYGSDKQNSTHLTIGTSTPYLIRLFVS